MRLNKRGGGRAKEKTLRDRERRENGQTPERENDTDLCSDNQSRLVWPDGR